MARCGCSARVSSAGAGAAAATGDSAATLPWRVLAATETKPKIKPAAPAAKIVQREPPRRDTGASLDEGAMLETVGASLGGGADSNTGRGGTKTPRSASLGGGSSNTTDEMRGSLGVGMARSVIFSLMLIGAGSLGGGGGGKLERATGISPESGASPPRTTTA